jgi:hypothetical protein
MEGIKGHQQKTDNGRQLPHQSTRIQVPQHKRGGYAKDDKEPARREQGHGILPCLSKHLLVFPLADLLAP